MRGSRVLGPRLRAKEHRRPVRLPDHAAGGRRCDRGCPRVAEAVAASFAKPIDALDASAGSVGLYAAGLDADIAFCAQESITTTVPRLVRTIGDVAIMEALPESAGVPGGSPHEIAAGAPDS